MFLRSLVIRMLNIRSAVSLLTECDAYPVRLLEFSLTTISRSLLVAQSFMALFIGYSFVLLYYVIL